MNISNDSKNYNPDSQVNKKSDSEPEDDPYKVYGFVKVMLNIGCFLALLSIIYLAFSFNAFDGFPEIWAGELFGIILIFIGYLIIGRYKTSGIFLFIASAIFRMMFYIVGSLCYGDDGMDLIGILSAVGISVLPLVFISCLLFIPGKRGSTWSIMRNYQAALRQEETEA